MKRSDSIYHQKILIGKQKTEFNSKKLNNAINSSTDANFIIYQNIYKGDNYLQKALCTNLLLKISTDYGQYSPFMLKFTEEFANCTNIDNAIGHRDLNLDKWGIFFNLKCPSEVDYFSQHFNHLLNKKPEITKKTVKVEEQGDQYLFYRAIECLFNYEAVILNIADKSKVMDYYCQRHFTHNSTYREKEKIYNYWPAVLNFHLRKDFRFSQKITTSNMGSIDPYMRNAIRINNLANQIWIKKYDDKTSLKTLLLDFWSKIMLSF